jgi:hypothetical protein
MRIALMAALVLSVACSEGRSVSKHLLQGQVKTYLTIGMIRPKGGSVQIQQMIDSVPSGGTVHLPSGCFEISDPIRVPDGTRVIGDGAGRTILYRHPDKWKDRGGAMIVVKGAVGSAGTQVSRIAFVGVRNTRDKGNDEGIHLENCTDFRIDHCYFDGIGYAGVNVRGASRGVIDHCVFVDVFKEGIDNLGYGVVVYGTQEWDEDPGLGTARATFVEDCEFIGCRHAVASNGGAHYVFRNNRIRENVVSTAIDAHGQGYGSKRGTQCVEIYRNVVDDPETGRAGIGIRGGSGVIFENEINGYDHPIQLVIEWGTPDHLKSIYPVADQIQNLWIWHNRADGSPAIPLVHSNSEAMIREGRDYFVDRKPGYASYTYPHPLTVD